MNLSGLNLLRNVDILIQRDDADVIWEVKVAIAFLSDGVVCHFTAHNAFQVVG